jgi:hypothetical protein
MNPYLPYIIVVILGGVVGIAEVIATFSQTPRDAFRTYWAWILVAVNMGAAAGVLAISQIYAKNAHPVLLAVAIGIGLPTLIRTKFTVAKQFMGGEELSINVGWLYDQLLGWFKTEIDIAVVNDRQKIIGRLLQKIPEVDKLKDVAHTVLQGRSLFTAVEVQKREDYINGIATSTIPDAAKRVALARFIWDMGGREYIENLIRG